MVQKIKSSNIDADVLTGNTELAEAANNADTVLVHDTSAGTLKKIQVSNLTAQAGDGLAKTNSTLAVDIPNTTLLNTGAAANDEVLIYDTSASALRSITQTNLLNFPTVSSVSPTNVVSGDGTGNHTFVITGVGFTGATAALVNDSGSTIAFDTVTVDSNTQITGVIAKSSLPNSGEPYDVKVTAATGLAGTLENQINIDAAPVYSTAAGSLGTFADGARSGISVTAVAADPESGGDVVYTIESGSIPAGLSFSSTSSGAVISGDADAVGSNTTSNFTIRAKDVNSNTSDRAFSITVNAPQTTSFTSSGTFTVPTGLTAVDVLVVAGGGGGGREAGGGGGAGGLIFRPGFTVTPGATITVTVGNGGAGIGSGDPASNSPGQDSVFGTLTAKGGGGGVDGGGSGQDGGSGSGGHGNGNAAGGNATQPTQSGESGNFGFGNNGGSHVTPGTDAPGGGGGGAGAAGGNSRNPGNIGDGGNGKSYTIADGTTAVFYAGGGGGGGRAQPQGAGGQGGAGNGGRAGPKCGAAATANRGSGGGGGAGGNAPGGGGGLGGGGGKGIVIVRY